MLREIAEYKLPRGVWQKLIVKALKPLKVKCECSYPNFNTVVFDIYVTSKVWVSKFDTQKIKDKFENAKTDQRIAQFSFSFLPGCRAILVSHDMYVDREFRGQGIAKKLQPIKRRIAKDLKAGLLLATVRNDNIAERRVIKNWRNVKNFKNPKSGDKVGLWLTDLY